MSLIGFVQKVAVGGLVAGAMGVGGFIAGSMPPPPNSNQDLALLGEEEGESSSLGAEGTQHTHTGSSVSQGHSNGQQLDSAHSSGTQAHGSQSASSHSTVTVTTETSQETIRHCDIVLTSKDSNQKIFVCQDSKEHLSMNNKWGTMKWYLYDSSQHTLKEISGLWIDNEKPKLLWNWFGYEYFYRWYHWWDSFWTGKYWKPFFIDSKNQITTFEAQFELPWKDNNKKFDPIYQRLHNFYSTRCGWRATQCSKFKVNQILFK